MTPVLSADVPGAARQNIEKLESQEDEFGARDLRSILEMKGDHVNRPLWVAPDGHVFLESFSPVYKHAHDFLIAISEVCAYNLCYFSLAVTFYSILYFLHFCNLVSFAE